MIVLGLLWAGSTAGSLAAQTGASAASEARAVAYLTAEVPRWRREHPCYSCHNNGDATRALLAATAHGHVVGTALDDTLAWLATPERWEQNASRGGSEELPLARIQFAGALVSTADAGRASQDALNRAAELLIPHQQADGSWQLNASQLLGGATFYGRSLATASARRVLSRAQSDTAMASRVRADAWLRSFEVATVLDASSVLIGLEGGDDRAAADQRARCLTLLRKGQGPDGGWGPYVTSPVGGLRHRAGAACVGEPVGCGVHGRRVLDRRTPRDDSARPCVPHRVPGRRRQLARDHKTARAGKLCAADLHDGVGAAGAAGFPS